MLEYDGVEGEGSEGGRERGERVIVDKSSEFDGGEGGREGGERVVKQLRGDN
jgi:hypothetical protein